SGRRRRAVAFYEQKGNVAAAERLRVQLSSISWSESRLFLNPGRARLHALTRSARGERVASLVLRVRDEEREAGGVELHAGDVRGGRGEDDRAVEGDGRPVGGDDLLRHVV